MAKFYGEIGFAVTVETPKGSGIWKETFTKKNYRGDIIRYARKLISNENVNDSVVVDNVISIVADPFANEHFFAIRYARWQGVRWKVSHVDVQYPRLNLTLGEVYNGPED
jgi:hypothetical protein